ncbi:odorant receptor 4-like [Phymastichus coffea]|uniref:odorant receptor 4-like n=1 Tax=Phymastichus coffea TaxID=108790 RepID=UPI00273B36D4|nr:odorant receptor 4-like [Phymastichus coffea]
MDVLPAQFRTLRYLGLWCEASEHQHWLVKYIWKPLVISIVVLMTLSMLGATQVYRDDLGELTECLFLSLTWLAFCLKLLNFLWRVDDMDGLLSEFRDDAFAPRTDDERRVLASYRRLLRIVGTLYMSIAQTSAVAFELLPLASLAAGSDDVPLPYKTYELYDRADPVSYSLAYASQVLAFAVGICANVSLDSLLSGFILLICAQIDISRRRFATSARDGDHAKATRDCAAHQVAIRRIIRKVQSFFVNVVVLQLSFSLITLCTSLYNVTRMELVESLVMVMYLGCLECQIFFYCWFGNELKLKTGTICDTICESDWAAFSPADRKNLYLILLVCRRDVTISLHGLCPITLDVYIWVLKTSYAIYNLLKTVEARNE